MNLDLPPTTLFRDDEQRWRAFRSLLSTAGLGHNATRTAKASPSSG